MNTIEIKDSKKKLFILGIQHAFTMFGATILVATVTGLNPSTALLTSGIGTLIFHIVTSRKVPIYLGSSFSYIVAIQVCAASHSNNAPIGSAAYSDALSYSLGGVILVGVIYVLFALVVKLIGVSRIRRILTPTISGAIIIIIGLMMAPNAIESITSSSVLWDGGWKTLVVTLITVITTICVMLLKSKTIQCFPIIIGITIGYTSAVCLGLVDFSGFSAYELITIPKIVAPKFDIQSLIIFAPFTIAALADHIGDIAAVSAAADKDYISSPGISKTILGNGLATIMAGFLGGPVNSTYSENTSLLGVSKNYNPVTLQIAGILAIVFSFIGKVSFLIESIPPAIMGGVSIILFGMITILGIRIWFENNVDLKNPKIVIIISVMLILGIGGFELTLGEVSLNGVAISALSGILFNIVFDIIERVKLRKQ